ncbi:flagellar biosynthesis protein P [Pseudenhygromyxa sp. WMMC2535]|uniref:VWA domain-containing protein n=1 Tax=Pseudenhygromyxa sp. WMMC2535 TaxID=2712867 RepID=UPI0015522582|nr:VWA domain-containing protein [Pseudenhygromyxa sp. WMMC2535]NVB37352.1 flagellar biosynthesis protein P [Pseudenhygromyxa sp. WMMC2535]
MRDAPLLTKRRALQLALLAGIAAAFVFGGREQPARADGDCPEEASCSVLRPNVVIVLDYSTSMNLPMGLDDQTRWEASENALAELVAADSYFNANTRLSLLRFGHDPDPDSPGTSIAVDDSGLIDGQAIDLAWDDEQGVYLDCQGSALIQALAAAGPPAEGALEGIEGWTKGALDRVAAQIAQTKADHPDDGDQRPYAIIVLTDGAWTSPDGSATLSPAAEDPGITASALFEEQGVPSFVITVDGDAQAQAAADSLALAGGSVAALHTDTPASLEAAVAEAGDAAFAATGEPACVATTPRVMILLDASSSMLNIDGGATPGPQGETLWDQARDALAGDSSIMDVELADALRAGEVAYFGLAVFGHGQPEPGEQELLVQYNPCMIDNFAWALDPQTSCALPGCDDPWGGPPITWTFKDGALEDPPGFDVQTLSHMPRCEGSSFCAGSGTYTNLGLELIAANQAQYHLDGLSLGALHPTSATTPYLNILITDGLYAGYATDAQVQAPLAAMFDAGVVTRVIGFGDALGNSAAMQTLDDMAQWGSGGQFGHIQANNQAELEQALAQLMLELDYDPCCTLGCYDAPAMGTSNDDPDPVPMDDAAEDDSDSSIGPSTEDSGSSSNSDSDSDSDSEDTSDTETSTTSADAGDELDAEDELGSADELGDGESDTDLPQDDQDAEGCTCTATPARRGLPPSLLLLLALYALGARGGTQRGSWRRDFRRGREAKTPLYRAYCKFW